MYIWQKLITLEEYNIGFYLKYIVDKIKELYIRIIYKKDILYNLSIGTKLSPSTSKKLLD